MNNRKRIFRMTAAALLVALVFLFGITPVGLIPLGFINITVLCVPVIIGTLALGLKTGLLLGFCFGTASTMSMVGIAMTPPSALASALFAANPVLALIMCYVPRLLVPTICYITYRALSNKKTGSAIAISLSAALGSLTNTVFYLGLMLLFYSVSGLDTKSILALIAGTGFIAGGCEAIAAAVISVPVVKSLSKTPIGVFLGGKE
ncbi:MAG: ECF transporter S component [Clostridia bacterium]|nr:ECF transporter S component [Clostridia bacterium]